MTEKIYIYTKKRTGYKLLKHGYKLQKSLPLNIRTSVEDDLNKFVIEVTDDPIAIGEEIARVSAILYDEYKWIKNYGEVEVGCRNMGMIRTTTGGEFYLWRK